MKVNVFILSVIVVSLLSACQTSEATPQQAGKSDDIENIRVKTVPATESVVDVEKFNLPNCGGTGELTQSLGTQASVLKGVTIGAKATTMAGGEVAIPQTAKLKLEIEVELAYQQTYQSANSRLDTIKMTAAKETDVTYVIFWEEQKFDSVVSYAKDGEVYEAPYSYVLRVPKIDDSYQENCSNSVTNAQTESTSDEAESVSTSTPTLKPTPTLTPYPVSDTEGCAIATPLPHRLPVVGEPWILPSGGWIHLNFWSNEPGIDQTEHKILLGPDDPRAFMGGGSAWQFPDGCESSARANYDPVPHPEISLEELRAQNLVR